MNTLFPYQVDGVRFLAAHRSAVIGDDPGLGKTAQAICAVLALGPAACADGILIVCPASLKLNWEREWKMWMGARAAEFPAPEIVSYDVSWKDKGLALSKTWSVAIFDEAHYLKNRTAKRTKKLLGQTIRKGDSLQWRGGVRANYRWFLTGTPITVAPKDFFNLLHTCDMLRFPNRMAYEITYCDGHHGDFGWEANGAIRIPQLRKEIEDSGCLLRRRKCEVLKDLPAKVRQVIEVPKTALSTDDRAGLRDADAIFKRVIRDAGVTEEQLASDTALYNRVFSTLAYKKEKKNVVIVDGEVLTPTVHDLRRLVAPAKVSAFLAWAKEELLETAEKVIVWAHYHDTIDAICAGLDELGITSVKFTGRETQKERDEAIQAFQGGGARVFVGSSAGYTGITLTAASRVIFVEASTVPSQNVQAEDRAHRIGQANPVLVQYLLVEGSYDVRILRVMVERMGTISQILDGK